MSMSRTILRGGTKVSLAVGILLGVAACTNTGATQDAQTIADLQHRVQSLEDVQAIERLERAYGHYVDKNLWDQVVDLFADDSTVELDQRGIFVGKAGVRRLFLETLGRGKVGLKKGTLFNHIQVEGVVDVDAAGHTAKARYHVIIQVAGFGGNDGFWSDGIYENEFVKDNGVWKFSKLKFWPTYYTPFHEGWTGQQVACINGDGSGMSPGADKPSTDHAGVYPDVYFPPYHYPNPVTGKPVDVSALNAEATARTTWPACPPRKEAAAAPAKSQ
jgi:hypothetical protein